MNATSLIFGQDLPILMRSPWQRIALVETRTLDTAGSDQTSQQLIRYQFGNHLGSASLELDAQAQIISYEEYSPYGSTTYQAARSQTDTAKRYRYTGKERDEESGLYYYGARYYAPWVGRWVSSDPAGFADGLCIYAYARGNPITYRDMDGRISEDTKENFKQLGRDMWGSWKQMTDLTEKYDKVTNAYEQSGLSEAAAVTLGVDELAERALYYEDHGATTSETVALMISERTGMTSVLEAATGESLEGETLTTGERIQKGITGGAGVLGTALGGVQNVRGLSLKPLKDPSRNPKLDEPKITRWSEGKKGTDSLRDSGDFVEVPGIRYDTKLSPKEAEAWHYSVTENSEYAVVNDNGLWTSNLPDRVSFNGIDPTSVKKATHTHPISGIAKPSDPDIAIFSKPGFSDDTIVRVVGAKYPSTNHFLLEIGLDPITIPIAGEFTSKQARLVTPATPRSKF